MRLLRHSTFFILHSTLALAALCATSALTLPDNLGPNLALHKPHAGSDENTHGWDGLTDGSWAEKKGTTFATGSSSKFPKYVTIDLQKPQPLTAILIGTPAFGATKTVSISLSTDNQRFVKIGAHDFAPKKTENHLFQLTKPVTARYVRLTFEGNHPKQDTYTPAFCFITEAEVYGGGGPTQTTLGATTLGNAGVPPADEGRPDPRPDRGNGQDAGRTLSASKTPPLPSAAIAWHDASKWRPSGRAWDDTPTAFSRLPRRAEAAVPKTVWARSQNSSGIAFYFRTNATTIRVRHEVGGEIGAMPHMTAVAASGLDLYARDATGAWRWAGATKPKPKTKLTEQAILSRASPGTRDYMLYLPLYNSTLSLEIGVPKNAAFEPLPPPPQKPIVYYGTSVAQGCSASRPGMAVPAQLGRLLDTPVINLGFSDSGRMEPAMADLVAEIDAALFILDCIPNMSTLPADEIARRVENCVRVLRKKHPATPIVLMEGRTHANAWLVPVNREKNATGQAVLHSVYDKLLAAGMTGLTYIPDNEILGTDAEATVDSAHPTDLGASRFLARILPLIKPLLSK